MTNSPSASILCKGINEIVVDYALSGRTKRIGVAQYQLSSELPESLKSELPTVEDLAPEFPVLSVLELLSEIEGTLHNWALRTI